jgi:hypothetical protein
MTLETGALAVVDPHPRSLSAREDQPHHSYKE